MSDVRVLIVADDALSRAGLAALLAQPGLTVAGQAPAAAGGLSAAIAAFRPDALLWDLGWNPAAALSRLPSLRDELASGLDGSLPAPVSRIVPVVALLPDASQASAAWAAGLRNLLLRDASPQQIASALAAAAQGLAVLDPQLATGLAAPRDEIPAPPVEALTARELEVLRLMAEGLPNKGIARALGISEHTVKFHVNAILGKLGVESRTEAVVHATRLGLVLL